MAAARGLNGAKSPSDGVKTQRIVQKLFILIKKTDAYITILFVFDCHVVRVISDYSTIKHVIRFFSFVHLFRRIL